MDIKRCERCDRCGAAYNMYIPRLPLKNKVITANEKLRCDIADKAYFDLCPTCAKALVEFLKGPKANESTDSN